ncbi:hypothetical protein AB2L27_20005 [Kineococcus sp. LSe6-4]|uniref:Type I restriction modification DNA specificity domain-containing protein n=1 Tax=Kineococcus halophytocola TaxID=3234027 RepID=A0ABV4H8L2_9ACTN
MAGLQRVPADYVASFPVAEFSLHEQRKIADFLDVQVGATGSLIATRERQIRLIQERWDAVLDSAMSPLGAPKMPVRHLLREVAVGIVIQPAALYVTTGGVRALRGVDVRPWSIGDESEMVQISRAGHAANPRSTLRDNDVVIVRTGLAGAAARVPSSLVGSNSIDVVIARPAARLHPDYLVYFLNSRSGRDGVTGQASGSIQKHFGVEHLKRLTIAIRTRVEQESLIADLEIARVGHGAAVAALTSSIRLLEERKQALITAAVTGQFDVATARKVSMT